MLIRIAVEDYMKTFPEDWEECKIEINYQKQSLENDMAEIKGSHALQRALYTIPEKLSGMIAMKLTDEERGEFREKESGRWFAKEFPQFSLTKHV